MGSMKIESPPAGYEERGMVIRIYPTPEQVDTLQTMQSELRRAWNWMCSRNEDALAGATARAHREGRIGPKPVRPDYNGLTSDESKAAKKEYAKACGDRLKQVPKEYVLWLDPGKEAVARGMRHDYQLLMALRDGEGLCSARHYQALLRNWQPKKGQGRKKHRKRNQDMPLQVRSLDFTPKLGDFGSRRGVAAWYNCQLKFPGLKGGLRGRLDCGLKRKLVQAIRVRQGITLRCEAGQWFATIKTWQPAKDRTGPEDGTIVGIDPGLSDWVALSDGTRIENKRGIAHSDRIAALQAAGKETTRAHLVARRHQKHMAYRLAHRLRRGYQTIGIEENHGVAVGVGHRHTSSTYLLTQILKDVCGADRVRVVEPCYNSQDCSRCGHRSKESWSRVDSEGRTRTTCQCLACGLKLNRDVNAARNVARKASELMAS